MSADDNAPEQAREVEVVRAALANRPSVTYGVSNAVLDVIAADILTALAPIRAAERQEAAREALIEAAEDEGWFDPTNLQHHLEDFRDGVRAMQDRLRDRTTSTIPAGTTDHEQQEMT